MTKKSCPLCKKDLSLKQVNYDLAVFICEDLECKYPVGYDCIVIERNLEDMNKELDKDDELNDWVNEIVKDSEKVQETTNLEISKNINQESIEWIDNLVEEAVNEVRRFECENQTVGESGAASTDDTDFDDILNFIGG